jgi:nucleoid-associated protein Lsr2
MVRKASVVMTDDIDGSPDAGTVAFGLDGVSYEIDLAQPNMARLAEAFAPFIAAGRRVSLRRPATAGRGAKSARSTDRTAVRAWARQAGLTVSERGRISAEVIRQYEAAHLRALSSLSATIYVCATPGAKVTGRLRRLCSA